MSKPDDFLLNTDYEMDKIIYFKEGKFTPGQFGRVEIPHTLGIAPLITGVWSKYADFSEPHNFSGVSGIVDPSSNSYVVDTVSCASDDNKIALTQFSGPISSQIHYDFYVRLMGFEPSGSHKNLPKTSQNANKFILNTDYNYLKLYKAGAEDVVDSGGMYQPITIQHDLGYHAQALFWVESFGLNDFHEILPLNSVEMANIYVDKRGVESYTDKFIVYPPSGVYGTSHKIQYRIYYDPAQ